MEYRSLEITLVSAEGIKNMNTFGKMNVYAVASIFGYPQSKKTTKVDKNCGTSPNWNEKMQFTIDERSLSNPGMVLVIQLKADKSFRPDRSIGDVAIPIPELFKNNGDDSGAERVVEYQVRRSSGKPQGTLQFSYKFGEKVSRNTYNNSVPETKKADEPVTAYPPNNVPETKKADEPVTAYPPAGYKPGQAGVGVGVGVATPAPAMAYPANPGMGYQQPPPTGYPGYTHQSAPPQAYYGGYPPQGGYPNQGYGYPAAPAGYGYQQPVQPPKKKKNGMGMGMGLGLGAGLLGGMLIGDMVSDYGEMSAYNDGYGDAMGDMGDFDF